MKPQSRGDDNEAMGTDSQAMTDDESLDKTNSDAVDAVDQTSVEVMEHGEGESKCNAVTLSVSQAKQVHHVKVTIVALQSTLEQMCTVGALRGIQIIESELHKELRRERELVK